MKGLLAYLSMITAAVFLVAVFLLLFLAADIDPMHSGISFYALTSYAIIINLALALIGASGIFLALALWSTTPSVAGRTGLVLLIAWGITSILAGVFPLDAPGAPPTLSGSIHNMMGLNFLLITPAVFLIELTHSSPGDAVSSKLVTYWLAWLIFIAAILLFAFNGPLSSLGAGGLIQRLYWLVVTLWLLFKAQYILRVEREGLVA